MNKKVTVPLAVAGVTVFTMGAVAQFTSADKPVLEKAASSDVSAEDKKEVTAPIMQKVDTTETQIVNHVIVEGNQNVKTEDIMKLITNTKENEPYSKDKVKEDLKAISASGVVQDVQAQSVQNNGEFYVVFQVKELSEVKSVAVSGNTLVPTDKIIESLLTKEGEFFSKEHVDHDVDTIKDLYKEAGYIAIVSDVNNKDGNVTFTIAEARVEAVNYRGNTKTKNWVIDKTVNKIIKTGDFLTTDALQKLYTKLMQTGYFNPVDGVRISADEGTDADHVVLNIDFIEGKTGEWRLGAGYSNHYKGQVVGGVSEGNLGGKGEKVGVNFGVGKGKTEFDLYYTIPYWKKSDTSVSFNVFNNSKDIKSSGYEFKEKHSGGSVSMLKPIGKDQRTKFFSVLSFDNIKADDVKGLPVDGVKSNTLTLGVMNDRRDDSIDTRNGSYSSVSVTTSQKALGSDHTFTKFMAEVRGYKQISKKDVLATRLLGQYSPDSLPTVEQFTIGGMDSVRGMEEDAQRGNKAVLATMELRHDLSKNVQGVIFVDAGKAWNESVNNSLKVAGGLGVRFKTAMGIMRIDIAKGGGDGVKYMFGIGQSF